MRSGGFYSYCTGLDKITAHVAFSHQVGVSASYFIAHCPWNAAKKIISRAKSHDRQWLYHPLAVDAYIANGYCSTWEKAITRERDAMGEQEKIHATQLTLNMSQIQERQTRIIELHHRSRMWHIIYENLADYNELLAFLLSILRKYNVAHAESHQEADRSVKEFLTFLMSRNSVWRRWVVNYNERTKTSINIYFHFASQSDTQANLDIAKFMKVIAMVTLLTLPGTFVATILNMSTHWPFSYFFTITMPFTFLLGSLCIFWECILQNLLKLCSRKSESQSCAHQMV